MLHPLVYFAPLLLGDLLVALLQLGLGLLKFEAVEPFRHVLPVGHVGHGVAWLCFVIELLDVDDPIGRVLDESLVVGYEENARLRTVYERLQPFQSLDVDVVGGLVQKEDGGPGGQHPCDLHLHLFSAGKCPHDLVGIEQVGIQLHFARHPGNLRRIHLREEGLLGHELVHRQVSFAQWEFLGQVGQLLADGRLGACGLGVVLYHLRVIYPFEQGGLAFAFLADDHDLVAGIHREGQAVDEHPVIFVMYKFKIVYLKHKHLQFRECLLSCKKTAIPFPK